MLNRWEGGSLSDWIHEQALYTNVASTGDSAEDVKKNLDECVHFPLLESIDVKPFWHSGKRNAICLNGKKLIATFIRTVYLYGTRLHGGESFLFMQIVGVGLLMNLCPPFPHPS